MLSRSPEQLPEGFAILEIRRKKLQPGIHSQIHREINSAIPPGISSGIHSESTPGIP